MEAQRGHDRDIFFVVLTRWNGRNAMTDPKDDATPEDVRPAAELLPEVYAELRRLAAALTAKLHPGQTLQPTALVHEAYLRLVRSRDPGWEGRRHFFGAAVKAMREILIEQARRKTSQKRGGQARRIELAEGVAWIEPPADDLLALDEAIQLLQEEDPQLAEIVQLRYYTGLTVEETAVVVGGSASTIKRDWRYARAWLARLLGKDPAPEGPEGADA
jgi:RNA polymerase sigma factor (TIGR02999 family)